ncbi:CDT1-like protein a, chloroplastic [Morella rubra]|uniref:CDT1-like protein a, chloroplastic n=1 Tax=Morella rubra TaxID=262757 RepID=A0A6A1VLZ3_9ROSI|nr:CDT1-like protein a, chloroplastic [Morella rubra]
MKSLLVLAWSTALPAKMAYTPARLMTSTPELHPPKRCYMSPEDRCASLSNKLIRRPPASRESYPIGKPIINFPYFDPYLACSQKSLHHCILPENLIQSIREKVRKFIEEQNAAISKRRRQMIACLPKLFNKIHLLFQFSRQSVITKEELIHKIIASHFDILDRREVEEQLNLLLELVPEWISRKLAFGGDFLFW